MLQLENSSKIRRNYSSNRFTFPPAMRVPEIVSLSPILKTTTTLESTQRTMCNPSKFRDLRSSILASNVDSAQLTSCLAWSREWPPALQAIHRLCNDGSANGDGLCSIATSFLWSSIELGDAEFGQCSLALTATGIRRAGYCCWWEFDHDIRAMSRLAVLPIYTQFYTITVDNTTVKRANP